VGQSQQQRHKGLLIFRFDAQYIATNAFSRSGFVEQTIAQCLFKRSRNSVRRKLFEFKHDLLLSVYWGEHPGKESTQRISEIAAGTFIYRWHSLLSSASLSLPPFSTSLFDLPALRLYCLIL